MSYGLAGKVSNFSVGIEKMQSCKYFNVIYYYEIAGRNKC